MSTTDKALKSYRIGTDTKADWKIKASTHGPIRPKTLTVKYQYGTAPAEGLDMLAEHRKAAQALATRIHGEGATVELHSGNGVSSMDWEVWA